MRGLQKLALAFVVAMGACPVAALADDEALGWWGGTIEYRDDDLRVRLHVTRNADDELVGWLDIPDLVYAGEAVPVHELDEGAVFTVDYPFGLGEIPYFVTDSGRLEGGRQFVESALRSIDPPPYRTVDITFESVAGSTSATIYVPHRAGPHPAVVVAGGSNSSLRSNWGYASWADYFARRGIAALIYDRTDDDRVLEDGTVIGIAEQAEEFAAAVRFTQGYDGIDGRRVGVYGSSRGAWYAIYASVEVENVAFAILSSASPLTPAEQTIEEVRARVFDATGSWDDVSRAEDYMRLYFYVAATGEGWELLEDEIESVPGSALHGIVDEPRRLADLGWWGRNMDFPVRSYLSQMTVPALGLWGAADVITPPAVNAPLLGSFLPGRDEQLTTIVYDRADHRLEMPLGETEDGSFHWFGVAPVEDNDMIPWLRSKGILR